MRPTVDATRASLYRARINVWVEDETTRAYLSGVWNDASVQFLIGGGNDGVWAVVDDAISSGISNVFGVTDRDFRPTNRGTWNDERKRYRVFVLPVHEIENYLLDPWALSQCRSNNRSLREPEIEEHLLDAARSRCWWAACRDVLADLKRRFRDGFVGDPPQNLADGQAARAHICESRWYRKLEREVAGASEDAVIADLHRCYEMAVAALDNGDWRAIFAGKEILQEVISRMFDQSRLSRRPSPAEIHVDIAKEVAAIQRDSGTVPLDLVELRGAFDLRIAGSPPSASN